MGRVIEPRKSVVVEADAVQPAEGSTGAPDDHGCRGSIGVGEQGTCTQWRPRNLGGLADLLVQADSGLSAKQTRGLREPRVERAGAQAEHEHDAHTRYRRAKETKRRGKGDEKSETLVVPTKSGNSPREDPAEGRGVRNMEPSEGTMSETLNSGSISTKLARIAKLARRTPSMCLLTERVDGGVRAADQRAHEPRSRMR